MLVFINYRRADSKSITLRIDEYLAQKLGRENVFCDTQSIRPAVDYEEKISKAIRASRLLLAIIGADWASERLMEKDDWFRRELELAHALEIPILPVLVEEARMPTADSLPETLKFLAKLHAVRVDSDEFSDHATRLLRRVRELTKYWSLITRRDLIRCGVVLGCAGLASSVAILGRHNTLRFGFSHNNRSAIDELITGIRKEILPKIGDLPSLAIELTQLTNADAREGLFRGEFDLITVDEPWFFDRAPGLANIEELAGEQVNPDPYLPGLLENCRRPSDQHLVGVPFRFNAILQVTRLDRMRQMLLSQVRAPATFDEYAILIRDLRERGLACPVRFYNENENSQAELFLTLYRMRSGKAEEYVADGPICFERAAAEVCRNSIIEWRKLFGKGPGQADVLCSYLIRDDQMKNLLGDVPDGAVLGHVWASWLMTPTRLPSEDMKRLLEGPDIDLCSNAACPVGGSWIFSVPVTTPPKTGTLAARLAIRLSASRDFQRLLARCGFLPTHVDQYVATNDALPGWARKTFLNPDNSIRDVVYNTQPRFRTHNWFAKQNGLAKYIRDGSADPASLLLVN